MNKEIKLIRDWAVMLHANQKYGEHDYVYHLDKVYELGLYFGLDDDYLMAAYLHDTIEDCQVTKEDIETKANKHIANMVWAVSGFGETRKERKIDMIEKMYKYPASINLKLLDRCVNMMESKLNNPKLFQMYLKEMKDYEEVFKLGDSKIYQFLLNVCDIDCINQNKKGLKL